MKSLEETWDSEEFKEESIKRMTKAIEIPTMSFDDMGEVGEDERWGIFEKFHTFLEESFPLV